MATQVEKAIEWAQKQIGSSSYSGRCQAFVADCFAKGAGMTRASQSSAKAACSAWRVSTDWSDVPAGAAVYFNSPSSPQYGHVGLCIGGGKLIHAFGKVKQHPIAYIDSLGYTCLGWGWNGGTKPTGAGEGSYDFGTNSYNYSDDDLESDTGTDGDSAEETVIHIPQTEKIYTSYERDNTTKAVDSYKVAWRAYNAEKAKDISGRVGKLKLTDDYESIATELSFDVIGSADDAYIGFLDIQTGDRISLTNTATNECIFVGTVEKTSGTVGETVSVSCYDGGAKLGYNDVLAQFDNCTAYKAISHIASLCGISRISCPDLVSSVYETYKTKASTAIQGILETIQGETGVIYFPRVIGNCLVVKSFANANIVPYFRQADNLQVLPCMAEVTEPVISRDSTGIKTSVQVYSTADKTISVLATAEDTNAVARYGKRNGLATYSDSDGVQAQEKAANTLKEDGRLDEKYTCTAFGSDRIVSGARFYVPVKGEVRLMYVASVEHSYDTHHTVKLTMIDAEGVNG